MRVLVSGDFPDDATGDRVEHHSVLESRRRRMQDNVLLQDVWTLSVQLRYRVHQPGQVGDTAVQNRHLSLIKVSGLEQGPILLSVASSIVTYLAVHHQHWPKRIHSSYSLP
jgi:hypothetical protein